MMNITNIDLNDVNKIIKKIISEIESSRGHILQIVDNIRNEQETLKIELDKIKKEIYKVIEEVDTLQRKDKLMRQKLAEVSRNFKTYKEEDIKAAYENAADIRIKFVVKQNEEQELKRRRTNIEIALRKSIENIENAERIIRRLKENNKSKMRRIFCVRQGIRFRA